MLGAGSWRKVKTICQQTNRLAVCECQAKHAASGLDWFEHPWSLNQKRAIVLETAVQVAVYEMPMRAGQLTCSVQLVFYRADR